MAYEKNDYCYSKHKYCISIWMLYLLATTNIQQWLSKTQIFMLRWSKSLLQMWPVFQLYILKKFAMSRFLNRNLQDPNTSL